MDNLKEHLKETKQLTEQVEAANEKLAIAKEENFDMKIDILSSAFGMLMTNIFKSIDDWLKINAEKLDNEKQTETTIKDSIEKVITAIAQQKAPTVEFKPSVNVSLSSLQPFFEKITNQNQTYIALIEKLNAKPDSNEKLVKLITTLIEIQNAFLKREYKQFDYTEQLKSIAQKPEYAGKITKRDDAGRIDTWTMKPVNNSK